ncbi:MAG: alpha-amylase family glycosyl hydrolase [Bacteroidales bacterium]|nr:alpha-amylase family glycosyl hydrolase [Bacteroidales bacterium]
MVIKGKAGSPYAIKDYYDVNPDLAENPENRIEEFEQLVSKTHEQAMKVIIDFVPNHLAREYHSDKKPNEINDFGENDDTTKAFDRDNNFYYIPGRELQLPEEIKRKFPNLNYHEFPAKATGNDQFTEHPGINDWYETVKLNYGVDYLNGKMPHFEEIPDTWKKMEDILKYWAGKGVDGFRCDMAEMVPVEFWEWVIKQVKAEFPDLLFIAEIYNPQAYSEYVHRGGFDYLYDKVGLYDTLKAVMCGEEPASNISSAWQNLNGLDAHMLRFLENHDEQRIASRFFAGDAWKGIPAMLVSACMNTGPAMLYFGQEAGEPAKGASGFSGDDGRTTIFDYWRVPEHQKWMNKGRFDGGKLDSSQKALREKYREIIHLSQREVIANGAFYDLMHANQDNPDFDTEKVYAFIRYTDKERVLFVADFSYEDMEIKIRIPEHALEVMSLKNKKAINFQLHKSDSMRYSNEVVQKEGIPVKVFRNNFLVLELIS